MYYFDQDPMYPEGDRRYGHRSPHGQDVDFVFQSLRPGNNPTAKYGNPNGKETDSNLPVWPLFKNEDSQVMVLTGEGPHPAPVASEAAMKVLDEYFAWRRSQE